MIKLRLPHFAPALLALVVLVAPLSLRAEEATKEKPLTKNQEKYDADKDGKLNDAEKAAAKAGADAKSKATHAENLAKYDTNLDGKLDKDEKAKMKADQLTEKEAMKAERAAKKAAEKK
jgi:hypothetical protein